MSGSSNGTSTPMIDVRFTLTGMESLVARFRAAPALLLAHLKSDLVFLAIDLRDAAARRTNPKTGRLAASIQSRVATQGDKSVSLTLFSEGVPYAHAQEFGHRYPPRQIFAAKAEALAFVWAKGEARRGDVNFYNNVLWPGAVIPPKQYIAGALRDKRAEFEQLTRDAMTKVLQETVGP
jgi:hypothetical protein